MNEKELGEYVDFWKNECLEKDSAITAMRRQLEEAKEREKRLREALERCCEVGGTYDCESQGCLAKPIARAALRDGQKKESK